MREDVVGPFNRLFAAVAQGDVAEVRACIEAGMDVNQPDSRWVLGSGNTPLHNAANLGHVEIVRLLLEAGGEVNARCDHRWTPLLRACNAGHLAVARVLREYGADPNVRNDEGYNAYGRIPGHANELMRLLEAWGGKV